MKMPPRKLAIIIFEISVLILGEGLKVYLFTRSKNVFSIYIYIYI